MEILQKETFEFRVGTEEEAVTLIEKHKAKSSGLVTYKTAYKTKKEGGEVVDDWYIVTVIHNYKV